jgi:uncharacterized protein YfaS (alpha-2-macroglobulin family)
VAKGFRIERDYYTLGGKKVELASASGGTASLQQTERLVVVLRIEGTEAGGRVLLVDRLPAGLEIENPLKPSATVAYIVRAVTPGSFVHPAATVEDMYRPDRFARTAAGRLDVTPRD